MKEEVENSRYYYTAYGRRVPTSYKINPDTVRGEGSSPDGDVMETKKIVTCNRKIVIDWIAAYGIAQKILSHLILVLPACWMCLRRECADWDEFKEMAEALIQSLQELRVPIRKMVAYITDDTWQEGVDGYLRIQRMAVGEKRPRTLGEWADKQAAYAMDQVPVDGGRDDEFEHVPRDVLQRGGCGGILGAISISMSKILLDAEKLHRVAHELEKNTTLLIQHKVPLCRIPRLLNLEKENYELDPLWVIDQTIDLLSDVLSYAPPEGEVPLLLHRTSAPASRAASPAGPKRRQREEDDGQEDKNKTESNEDDEDEEGEEGEEDEEYEEDEEEGEEEGEEEEGDESVSDE